MRWAINRGAFVVSASSDPLTDRVADENHLDKFYSGLQAAATANPNGFDFAAFFDFQAAFDVEVFGHLCNAIGAVLKSAGLFLLTFRSAPATVADLKFLSFLQELNAPMYIAEVGLTSIDKLSAIRAATE